MKKLVRRFGTHEVQSGPYKGRLHTSTKRYKNFIGELSYLSNYISRRLMPQEPEDQLMRAIIIDIFNLLDHEMEILIEKFAVNTGEERFLKFTQRIKEGFVTFRSKCDWLKARGQINQDSFDFLNSVREIRNGYAHARPEVERIKFQYKKFPLLTIRSLRQVLVDAEIVLVSLRKRSGNCQEWRTIPPRYENEKELYWNDDQVRALKSLRIKPV